MSGFPLPAVFLISFVAAGAASASFAQYPVKAVRTIVPFAPGSGPDIMARTIGQKLTPEQFGAVMRNDIAKWAKVVRASGARVE